MATIEIIGQKATAARLRRISSEAVAAIVSGSGRTLEAEAKSLRGTLQEAIRTTHPAPPGATGTPLEDDEWWKTKGPEKSGGGYQLSLSNTKTVSGKGGAGYNLLALLRQGTRAHEIEGDPYLSFEAGGEHVTMRGRVQHPGTKADPFIDDALQDYQPQLHAHVMQGATAAVLRLLRGRGKE